MIKTLKRAQEVSGKLTMKNKKVPGSSFPTSTKMCGVGGKLKLVPGSTCHGCYAARKLALNIIAGLILEMRILSSGSWRLLR